MPLLKNLLIIEASSALQNEQSIDSFIKMWKRIICILSDCEGISLFILEDLATSLLRATHPQRNQSQYMTSILESINILYPYASSGLRLEICHFFHRCAANITNCHSNVIAELLYQLLSDSDSYIQQQAFESFDCLTRLCPDTNLLSSVALFLRNTQSELSKTLPAFLSGEQIHTFTSLANLEEFFITLCYIEKKNNWHVCPKKNECSRDEKLPKIDEDTEKQAERICTDLELILKLKKHLRRDVCERLSDICQRFINQS